MDRSRNDDRLLASMLNYLGDHAETDVRLITQDYGPRLKALKLSVNVELLDEKYALAKEPDPVELELQEVRSKLAKYEAAMPKLEVMFSDGEKHKQVMIPTWDQPTETWIQDEMKRVQDEYPKHSFDRGVTSEQLLSIQVRSQMLYGPEEIERYNEALDRFYEDYEMFLRDHQEKLAIQNRSFELDLVLANTGTLPAHDIDLLFELPGGFSVTSETPTIPEAPTPPSPPKTAIEKIMASMRYPGFSARDLMPRMPTPPGNVTGLEIKETNSYQVEMNVASLKHEFLQPLLPVWIVFGPSDTPAPFTIDYRVIAGNIPGIEEGQLHVVVRGEQS